MKSIPKGNTIITRIRHREKNRRNEPTVSSWRLKWPFIALALSTFLAGFAIPGIHTVVKQAAEIIPGLDRKLPFLAQYMEQVPYAAAIVAIQRQSEVLQVRQAFQKLASGTSDQTEITRFQKNDPDNGLYLYLRLLLALRTNPMDESMVRHILRQLSQSTPPRLYLTRQIRIAQEALLFVGAAPRPSAAAAWQIRFWIPSLREIHGPVLRELVQRLIALGNTWRAAGRQSDSFMAHIAMVQLMTDLVRESPTPDLAILASELIGTLSEELVRDVSTVVSSDPRHEDMIKICRKAAADAGMVRHRLHELAASDGINILPYTGGSLHLRLASEKHDTTLPSFGMSLLSLTHWIVLYVLCMVFTILTMAARPDPKVQVEWRQGRWGPWLVMPVVISPLFLLLIYLTVARNELVWLFSMPTVRNLILLPVLLILLILLAARIFTVVRYDITFEARSPRWAYLILSALIAAFPLGFFLAYMGRHAWGPPLSITGFRWIALILGVESSIIIALLLVAQLVRSRIVKSSPERGTRGESRTSIVQNADQPGRRSRAPLMIACARVSAVSLLATTVITFICLTINQRYDKYHQEAFAQCSLDPLHDRLGENWFDSCFEASQSVLDMAATQIKQPFITSQP